MTQLRSLQVLCLIIGSVACFGVTVRAVEPLHKQIDTLLVARAGSGHPVAERTTDAEFLRRVYLDLSGSIPSAKQAREFLADSRGGKRVALIDKLLASPQYARRMQIVFDVMLMERRGSTHVKSDVWEDYLWNCFRTNQSWLQISSDLLTADGAEEKTRPAARFMLDRELNVDEVTRDLGRIFLGRDLQCAQCHDHPAIDDYLQRHYYGLAAFIKRSSVFKDPKTKMSMIAEKAEGEVEFTSVFTSEKETTAPRLLDADPIPDPPVTGELYKVAPAKDARSVPIYSRRLQLAQAITAPENIAFRHNIANRLWALMMGKGLVEPLDMWHEANPPTHPKLLELLATALLEHDYDLKYVLRELALTGLYQRSSQYPGQGVDHLKEEGAAYAVASLKPLSPEQLAWSMMEATGVVQQQLLTTIAKEQKVQTQETHEKAKAEANAAELSKQDTNDPVWRERSLNVALRSNVDAVAKVFGREGSQHATFDASADQALFLRNGDLIQRWVALKGGLSDRLVAMEDSLVAEEYYLSIFSRMPCEEEVTLVRDILANSVDRKKDIRQLVWAGLASAEFRFNH